MSTQDRTQDRYAYRTGARHERARGEAQPAEVAPDGFGGDAEADTHLLTRRAGGAHPAQLLVEEAAAGGAMRCAVERRGDALGAGDAGVLLHCILRVESGRPAGPLAGVAVMWTWPP